MKFPTLLSLLEKDEMLPASKLEPVEDSARSTLGRAEVLAALRSMTPSDRKEVCTKLQAMIALDEK